jgi:hypothetical protein
MFVRNTSGIQRFVRLVAENDQRDVWKRLSDLQKKYERTCPECRSKFWINFESVSTHWLDGELIGYRCPEPGCKGIVKLQEPA